MEQGLVNSAKYQIYLHSLDSRFADFHEYNNSTFKMVLPHPLKNIMRVRMASIELPLVEYLFSEQYGNLTLGVQIAANPIIKLVTIQAGNYTASDLIAEINTQMAAFLPSGLSCTLNSFNGTCTIKHTSLPFTLYLFSSNPNIARRYSYWGLGYYLGFRLGKVVATQGPGGVYSATGPSVVNIQQNQYYILQLYYPDPIVNVTHRLADDGFLDGFAKIILKDGAYTITFDDNSNLLRKEFTFLAPVTISQFTFKLLNQYGEPVNMLNVDWSVTLEITEVVNSNTYNTISKTYNK